MIWIGSTVLNVIDLERSIVFWTGALKYEVRSADESFAVLHDPRRQWSNLSLQKTDEPKHGLNRLHLDLYAEDQAAEVERLAALGATRVEPWPYAPDADYVVMSDPDGNEFCVVQR
jgi:catechol 2,3-dioxygenase-like lactoylglutathione lyase family enzyme